MSIKLEVGKWYRAKVADERFQVIRMITIGEMALYGIDYPFVVKRLGIKKTGELVFDYDEYRYSEDGILADTTSTLWDLVALIDERSTTVPQPIQAAPEHNWDPNLMAWVGPKSAISGSDDLSAAVGALFDMLTRDIMPQSVKTEIEKQQNAPMKSLDEMTPDNRRPLRNLRNPHYRRDIAKANLTLYRHKHAPWSWIVLMHWPEP